MRSDCRHRTAVMAEYDELAGRLESVAAEIDDLAFDRLRVAVADGEVARPAVDKRLMQARRSIEKAAHILRELDESHPE